MFLRSLYLHNFRNYEEIFLEFDPGFNLICGSNAQGKTNILEAIYYLMMGTSFRSHHDAEMIRHGCSSFYIEATFSKHHVQQSIKIGFDGKERTILYNHTALSTVSSLLGIIPGVALTPDDINLIKGSPQIRRRFLDLQIAQVDPLYVHHLTRYTRATRQRNQLLKAQKMMTIESWEHEMSQSAAYLMLQRYRTIQELQSHCHSVYSSLTEEQEPIHIEYQSNVPSSMTLSELRMHQLTQLHKHRAREMMLGYTLTGPHKDDMNLLINQKEVRHFASEGQQRSYIAAIRFAEWLCLNRIGNDPPLFLIDDIGLSLDQQRRQRLLQKLTETGQVFLTSTETELLNDIRKTKKAFHIHKSHLICK